VLHCWGILEEVLWQYCCRIIKGRLLQQKKSSWQMIVTLNQIANLQP
jgi:hypothetical protein